MKDIAYTTMTLTSLVTSLIVASSLVLKPVCNSHCTRFGGYLVKEVIFYFSVATHLFTIWVQVQKLPFENMKTLKLSSLQFVPTVAAGVKTFCIQATRSTEA